MPVLRILLLSGHEGSHPTMRKVVGSASEAVADVPAGATLLVGGFGLSGVPENLITALRDRACGGLTVVSSNVGTSERGLGLLFQTRQIAKV
ncbi:3-oxoacid CoA-transferase, partial [Emiliania huxleyi CCMP1516]|uniref:Uncharacterized protein n=2 Tax=Emiliania huxleyi TaxID=2903 RepID=A0A0D3JB71_EMIH1